MPAKPPPPRIEISNTQRHLPINPAELEKTCHFILDAQHVQADWISLVLVDDATIHAVNRRQLGHDWPTDIITFPLSEPGTEPLSAELLISAQTALRAARESGAPPAAELQLYLVHGLLHLCGYDDHDPDDLQRMRQREALLLGRLGIPHPILANLMTHRPDSLHAAIGPETPPC